MQLCAAHALALLMHDAGKVVVEGGSDVLQERVAVHLDHHLADHGPLSRAEALQHLRQVELAVTLKRAGAAIGRWTDGPQVPACGVQPWDSCEIEATVRMHAWRVRMHATTRQGTARLQS